MIHARASGLRYHHTSLSQEFRTLDTSVNFDQKEMTKLFDEGRLQGEHGPGWVYGPPTLSPGDGDFVRSGLKLRVPQGGVPEPGN